jgi:transcription termination factor Rho
MNKAELESKHLSELHALAAEAGIDGYRMLPRPELIEKLAGGSGGSASGGGGGSRGGSSQRSRPPRERKERQPRGGGREGGRDRPRRERQPRGGADQRQRREPAKREEPRSEEPRPPATPAPASRGQEPAKPKRRRRRRFRRKGGKTVRAHEMLVPSVPGRQAIVYAETREGCTALLRELAAELSGGGKGPDPVALLVDPSPEELADWKREAPKAEIVSAGQERHAEDALSAAARRADEGEAVILLIDSLSRVAEAFGGSSVAKDLFDAGQAAGSAGGGSLTVVAAVERAS